MESFSNLSLPREKCIKCHVESAILLSSSSPDDIERCYHKFCQSCFRKENIKINTNTPSTFNCPYCHVTAFEQVQSIDEAVLIGEASTLSNYINPYLLSESDDKMSREDVIRIDELNMTVIDKLEAAIQLNCTDYYTIYLLFLSCCYGQAFLLRKERSDFPKELYRLKIFDCSYKLLDYPTVSNGFEVVKCECCHELAKTFYLYRNYSASVKYAKLAYEHCLRSPEHSLLSIYKDAYLQSRAAFAELPPLRFAVGDEVEFLHELETGSEWRQGKVVELYYAERSFAISFTAPYRLQLLDDSASIAQPPVYAWVKADLDRYVRKVGVRSIEDTRYQMRLDAKIAELTHVYWSTEFMLDIYRTLAQDREFVETLQSVWGIKLTELTILLYRMFVMLRQPLVRTDTGYHVPLCEEVIAGIRAFFDPAHLSGDAAPAAGEDGDSSQVRAELLSLFRGAFTISNEDTDNDDVQSLLLQSIRIYITVLLRLGPSGSYDRDPAFAIPAKISLAISRVSTLNDLRLMRSEATNSTNVGFYVVAWICIHQCLENPDAGPACECPFIYFFVKFCLDRGLGVPKLALTVYDRMNIQLSREFIRCANTTCELNKLDQSTGQVKFKQCSRCRAVIYCSRECQVAHYPEHKRLCRAHTTA